MADANAIRLDNLVLADVWAAAHPADRRAFLDFARTRAVELLRRQLEQGRDRHGRVLKRVKPASRPDGAKGPPLSPHDAGSRAQKWIRASAAASRRGITLWWSHGWGKILGYHGDGLVRGAPVRDVRGLAPATERTLRRDCDRWWKTRTRASRPARTRRPASAKHPMVQRYPYLRDYLD